MRLATPEQLEVLKSNYAKHDAACVETVKALYRTLDLENVYLAYETECYNSLKAKITSVCAGTAIPEEVYLSLLHKIYKRSK
ncbi:hypothetical protein EON67_07705 [archaeon]|nr:MAG: hypothetical protein EON67_07705 [archaeon]